MTVFDRLGQHLVVGDLVQFQFANLPLQQHTITAIGPETDLHATLNLAGHPDIDSLSVEKVDPPPSQDHSRQHIELTQGPIRPIIPIPVPTPDPWDTPTDYLFKRGPEPDVQRARAERDHPAPIAPKSKRAPAPSHKTPVKKATPAKKGTHNS